VLNVLKVDDPLDAAAVHGACGIWGVLAAAIFSTPYYAQAVTGNAEAEGGLVYGGGRLLGAAVVFVICLVLWSGTLSFFMFYSLNKLGYLRHGAEPGASLDDEDGSRHYGVPYDVNAAGDPQKHGVEGEKINYGAPSLVRRRGSIPRRRCTPPPPLPPWDADAVDGTAAALVPPLACVRAIGRRRALFIMQPVTSSFE